MASEPRTSRGELGPPLSPLQARPDESPIAPYVRALKAHWLIGVLVFLATLGAAVAYLSVRTPDYRADAEFLVKPIAEGNETLFTLPLVRDSGDPTRTIQTAAELIDSHDAAERAARKLQETLAGDRLPDTLRQAPPRTSFNRRISPHRRFAFGQLPLDEVKAVKNEHSVTVNDVVVSLCAGALRRWLLDHDELPAAPLVAQVPVSVRRGEEMGTYGNKIMLMSAPLFTNVEDPVERLFRTHDALSVMKERHKALPAQLLQDANHFVPPALLAEASYFAQGETLLAGKIVPSPLLARFGERVSQEGGGDVAADWATARSDG